MLVVGLADLLKHPADRLPARHGMGVESDVRHHILLFGTKKELAPSAPLLKCIPAGCGEMLPAGVAALAVLGWQNHRLSSELEQVRASQRP
jgi:hypothetical protein